MKDRFSSAPGVLISMPDLLDPNFHRSVVVMIQHDAEGALGLVINHPLEHTCADVVAGFGLPWTADPDVTLGRGGPVEQQSLWMLHDDGWGFDETMKVCPGVSVSRSKEALTRMCRGGERRLRLFVGYSGWGPGQLEGEIQSGSWLTAEAGPGQIFDWPPDEVWARSVRSLGIDPAHLVGAGHTVQ